MNSPMTTEEAEKNPEIKAVWQKQLNLFTVFVMGAYSLLVTRKTLADFFMFRTGFPNEVSNRKRLKYSLLYAHLGSFIMHLLIINIIGIVNWLVVFLPAAFIAAGIGSLLFWVQHNFEDTYYVDTEHWQYEKVGLKGSSYLKLPQPLTWITAHIGLHHIHHLNYKIPNYYLESARKAHPDLVSIQPLTYKSFRECFKKVFWNTHLQKMVSLDD